MASSARLVSAFRGIRPRISAVCLSIRRPEHFSGPNDCQTANSTAAARAEKSHLLRPVIGLGDTGADRVGDRHSDDGDADDNHWRRSCSRALANNEEFVRAS